MTDTTRQPAAGPLESQLGAAPRGRGDFNDPDAQNAEQSEAGTQAQDVAADARVAANDLAEDSEHGGKTNPAQIIPDDVPDLVDKMVEMVRSGRIDSDAFAGEELMDDMDDDAGDEDNIVDDD
jgi:hypothetical protein